MKILFFLLFSSGFVCAQIKISGIIYDKNKVPIPYASIGIQGKHVGTLSTENGSFNLNLSEDQLADSIRIFSISYKTLTFLVADLAKKEQNILYLELLPTSFEEVIILSKKTRYRKLGTTHYNKNNCTGFTSSNGNWLGSETAILIRNKGTAFLENFNFYVIHNTYEDSVMFRLVLYSCNPGPGDENSKELTDRVGSIVIKKSVIFKVGIQQGEFTLPLRDYSIVVTGDFFISMECLVNEMDIERFCFSSSDYIHSHFKTKAFSSWFETPYAGAEFNLKVSYLKD